MLPVPQTIMDNSTHSDVAAGDEGHRDHSVEPCLAGAGEGQRDHQVEPCLEGAGEGQRDHQVEPCPEAVCVGQRDQNLEPCPAGASDGEWEQQKQKKKDKKKVEYSQISLTSMMHRAGSTSTPQSGVPRPLALHPPRGNGHPAGRVESWEQNRAGSAAGGSRIAGRGGGPSRVFSQPRSGAMKRRMKAVRGQVDGVSEAESGDDGNEAKRRNVNSSTQIRSYSSVALAATDPALDVCIERIDEELLSIADIDHIYACLDRAQLLETDEVVVQVNRRSVHDGRLTLCCADTASAAWVKGEATKLKPADGEKHTGFLVRIRTEIPKLAKFHVFVDKEVMAGVDPKLVVNKIASQNRFEKNSLRLVRCVATAGSANSIVFSAVEKEAERIRKLSYTLHFGCRNVMVKPQEEEVVRAVPAAQAQTTGTTSRVPPTMGGKATGVARGSEEQGGAAARPDTRDGEREGDADDEVENLSLSMEHRASIRCNDDDDEDLKTSEDEALEQDN